MTGYAIAVVLRIAVGAVLVLAATAKTREFPSFRLTVRSLGVPSPLVVPIAAAIIAVEAVLGVGLLLGAGERLIPVAALVLFFGFSALSLWAAVSGIVVSCNCFGSDDSQLGLKSLSRSLLLGAGVAVYIVLPHSNEQPLRPEAVFAILGLAGGALLYGRWLLSAGSLLALVRQRHALERDERETLAGGA